jgi:hypothetical protein
LKTTTLRETGGVEGLCFVLYVDDGEMLITKGGVNFAAHYKHWTLPAQNRFLYKVVVKFNKWLVCGQIHHNTFLKT